MNTAAIAPRPPNLLKTRLGSGEPCHVFAVRSVRHAGVIAIAEAAGYQGVYLDFQHSPIDLESAASIFQTGSYAGLTVLSRVPSGEPGLIGRLLDAGGHGIMLADVRNEAQALALVAAALLHPAGERSLGMPIDPRFQGQSGAGLMSSINAATLLIAMIETEEGAHNAHLIAAVPGIDAIQIGTADLTASLGIPGQFGHARVQRACATVALACRAARKPFIMGGIRKPTELKPYLSMGAAKCYFTGSDTGFLLKGARLAVEAAAEVNPVDCVPYPVTW